MNLRIAKFLLLLTVMGTLAPAALAIAAPATHACCRRKSVHRCRESASTTADRSVLRSADCCNHDCCRGVTAARWAYTHSAVGTPHQDAAKNCPHSGDAVFAIAAIRGSQLTRGPPLCTLA